MADLTISVNYKDVTGAKRELDGYKKEAKEAKKATDELTVASEKSSKVFDKEAKEVRETKKETDGLANSKREAEKATIAAEQAALKYIQSLEREQAEIGQTRQQIKLMEIEANAVAAETMGFNAHALAIRNLGNAYRDTGKKAGVASHDLSNMVYQLNDVAVTAAMGMNPLMILMQQGTQIGQIAGSSGASIGQWAKALGLLNPYLWAAAAAVGVAAGAFVLFKNDLNEANKYNDEYIKSLKLSKAELKQLGDTTITTGDIMSGLWKTIDKDKKLSGAFESVKKWAVQAFRFVVEAGRLGFVTLGSVVTVWAKSAWYVFKNFPNMIGDAFYSGINLAIKAVQMLINTAIKDINVFVALINKTFGTKIKGLEEVQFGGVNNPFEGAMKGFVDVLMSGNKEFDKLNSASKEFIKLWGENSDLARNERVKKSLNEILKQRAEDEAKKKDPKAKAERQTLDTRTIDEAYSNSGKIEYKNTGKRYEGEVEMLPGIILESEQNMEKFRQATVAWADSFTYAAGQAIADGKKIGDVFKDSIKQIAAAWITSGLQKLFGINGQTGQQSGGGLLGAIFGKGGIGGGSGGFGGLLKSIFSFDGGGNTGTGPRSGGLDGKGGFLGMLHPNETITDHTRRGGGSGGVMAVQVVPSPYFDVRVSEVSTPIAQEAGSQAAYAGASIGQVQTAKRQRRRMS